MLSAQMSSGSILRQSFGGKYGFGNIFQKVGYLEMNCKSGSGAATLQPLHTTEVLIGQQLLQMELLFRNSHSVDICHPNGAQGYFTVLSFGIPNT